MLLFTSHFTHFGDVNKGVFVGYGVCPRPPAELLVSPKREKLMTVAANYLIITTEEDPMSTWTFDCNIIKI